MAAPAPDTRYASSRVPVASAEPRAPPTGALADLIRKDVQEGEVPLRLSRASLRGSGLAEERIRCSRCGDATCSHYLALERTAPLRAAPLAHSEMQLSSCPAATASFEPRRPRACRLSRAR